MKKTLITLIVLSSLIGCGVRVNQNFNYENTITPVQIKLDIDELKKNLYKNHFDIDWQGEKSSIFNDLDLIKNTQSPITIGSFESQLTRIINNIDDGHSRIIHQDSININHRNQFGYQSITDSIKYIRIGNFINTKYLVESLDKLEKELLISNSKVLIIDIRSNPGGNIQNVNRALSYFLPSNTRIYENVEVKNTSKLTYLNSKLLSFKHSLKPFKYTGKKKINKNLKIYLWVDQSIASGSMLFTFHLQNNGAFVIGKPPKGIFNTFGNQHGYRLKHSKIIFTLATAKVNITNKETKKINDILKPNYIPESDWNISNLVEFISENEQITTDNRVDGPTNRS